MVKCRGYFLAWPLVFYEIAAAALNETKKPEVVFRAALSESRRNKEEEKGRLRANSVASGPCFIAHFSCDT